jgi:plastocyanin
MAYTTSWSPNQASIAQIVTYTFTVPSSVGNTYTATINGKTVTYTSVSGDTAATAATGLYELLNVSTSIAPELAEITFANPSDAVMTATANVAGTPFANITINGVSGQGLVLTTGNGLASGISTSHTRANASPSDVNDPQNWQRANLSTTPPALTRAIPQSGDDVVVANSAVPMLWNLDRLSAVQFATYTRHQSFTATIGLPETNPGGYAEWRATYFKFAGPAGSVPAGGLQLLLGYDTGVGSGPTRERYDVGSQPTTLTLLATGQAADEYSVCFLGQHTANTFAVLAGSLGVAMAPGEKANLATSTANNGGRVDIGAGVTWTAASTLTVNGATANLNAAPATLTVSNGSTVTFATDSLTWATVTAQGGSILTFRTGGTVTTLTMTTGSQLDKSDDNRALTITNSTIDGDTCLVNDPLNAITWTNATSVRQQVASGPFRFTGTRTVKVT